MEEETQMEGWNRTRSMDEDTIQTFNQRGREEMLKMVFVQVEVKAAAQY